MPLQRCVNRSHGNWSWIPLDHQSTLWEPLTQTFLTIIRQVQEKQYLAVHLRITRNVISQFYEIRKARGGGDITNDLNMSSQMTTTELGDFI